jgi:hypothetical protein
VSPAFFEVVYDARRYSEPGWGFYAGFALVALTGIVMAVVGRRQERRWRRLSVADEVAPAVFTGPGAVHPLRRARWLRRLGRVIATVALVIGPLAGWLAYTVHNQLRDALQSGRYTRVEGVVTGFQRGDKGGHQDEVFSVHSGGLIYTYRYRHSSDIPAFHQSHGPVRDGLYVHIADVNGYIARLEIAR